MTGAGTAVGEGETPAPASAPAPVSTSPLVLGWRAIIGSWTGRIALAVLLFIVAASIAAPLWAEHVAKTGPFENHLTDVVTIDGEEVNVVSFDGIPIGPTFQGRYFLGADGNGRDLMVRLLYGGRNSLQIGVLTTLLILLIGTAVGVTAGYARGRVDSVISRLMEIIWSVPPVLLGVGLGVATATAGVSLGIVRLQPGSLLLPVFVISATYFIYIARPIRGAVLSLRERQYVEAARSQGASPLRIVWREILPNLQTNLIVLAPIAFAQTVSLEAALSFLGAGVQPPQASWGTLISDGLQVLVSQPYLVVIPGAVLATTVLTLNLLGDLVREATDPRGELGLGERR